MLSDEVIWPDVFGLHEGHCKKKSVNHTAAVYISLL